MKLPILLAPAFLFGYGIVRLIDGIDGVYGPGLAWSIGHLLFLAGFLTFAVVLARLPRLLLPAAGRRVFA